MPFAIEIPIDLAKLTASPFKSDLFALNNWQAATLMVQCSAPASAGRWVLKVVPTADTSIPGQQLIAVDFPATPARVASASAEIAHKWGYVEQEQAVAGAALEKVTVYVR